MALSKSQSKVLVFIKTFIDSHAYSPTFEEIALGIGLKSIGTIHKHIVHLEAGGYITRDKSRGKRNIDITRRTRWNEEKLDELLKRMASPEEEGAGQKFWTAELKACREGT